ncbi:Anthranilate phosphoribosyltransferase [Poriferisphaera corsica]|uniref:Anthranilate phosphoribosyltransferase n=1 Tax=Poriferisphaera corsica TaxID=2528020 RepID=A0A517YPN8_9BACT|nr:anthranilate phosphoribosyltransferase [Poriferisphaera corsica]QDU32185.1 Anthranilate phosphoribosyltransferase [Poriferisphaera corsica]
MKDLQEILSHIVSGGTLTVAQTKAALDLIMEGEADPVQTGAFLAMVAQRQATAEEITGAVLAMRERVLPVEVPEGLTAIDTCGMGGTKSRFFNISTSAAIVAAGAGRPKGLCVAKHGNRAITSRTGSSQVLEILGVNLVAPPETITQCLDEAGIGFCFAPAHHSAMRHAMPVRQSLGFRTLLNLIGPLTNPAMVTRQLVGVPSPQLLETIATVLDNLGAKHAMIVHSELPDGSRLGEMTAFAPTQIAELHNGMVKHHNLDPQQFGLPFAVPESIEVDSPQQSAELIRDVLAGKHGPARDIVLLNAAAALIIGGVAKDFPTGLEMSAESIDSGAATIALEKLVQITSAVAAS